MSSHTAHSEPFETIISGSEMFACSDDMARVVTGGAALIRCGSSDAEIRRQLTVEFGEDLVLVAISDARIVRGRKLRRGKESLNAFPVNDEAAFVRIRYFKLERRLLLQ